MLAPSAWAATEGLAICGKCISPSVFSKTGIGTDKAVARARYTRDDVRGWCENWQGGDKACVASQMAGLDLKKVFKAEANCVAGKLSSVEGQTFTLAGVWDNSGIGGGRSK